MIIGVTKNVKLQIYTSINIISLLLLQSEQNHAIGFLFDQVSGKRYLNSYLNRLKVPRD